MANVVLLCRVGATHAPPLHSHNAPPQNKITSNFFLVYSIFFVPLYRILPNHCQISTSISFKAKIIPTACTLCVRLLCGMIGC
jgi:hypothetical protein